MSDFNIIKFVNNSNLSIILETWMDGGFGLSGMKSCIIHPQETTTSFSSTGDYYIHHRFEHETYIKLKQEWIDFYKSKINDIDYKILNPNRLGKLRNKPIHGKFCWIESKYFQLNYVDGVIIFENI